MLLGERVGSRRKIALDTVYRLVGCSWLAQRPGAQQLIKSFYLQADNDGVGAATVSACYLWAICAARADRSWTKVDSVGQ